MSGIEIFGVITGAIALTETLLKLYKVIKTRNDLPEAFTEVGDRLPLVEETLELAKGLTDNLENGEKEIEALKQTLDDCYFKLSQLQEIFHKISKRDAQDKTLVNIYQKAVLKLKLDNKSGRVEALMKGVLESLHLFTMHRAFKDAMKTQAVNVGQAKEEMEKVAAETPSLPDSPEETRGDNVNYGEIHRQFVNWGEQTNIEGGQWNIAGAYVHGDQVLGDMNINTYQSTYMYSQRQSYYGLPHISGSHLVERVKVQKDIEAKFSIAVPGSLKPAVLVLYGIGGLGKTLIALDYCRSKNALANYQDVFWVDASSKTTSVQGFKKLASMLSGTDKVAHRGHITHEMIPSVLSEWSARWLLVFDNYDPDDFDIEAFFPENKEGSILITTRDSGLECRGWESIEIPAMTDEEALDLFLHKRHRAIENLSLDSALACSRLFRMLGNLPLAIDHVAQTLPGRDLASEIHKYMKRFDERKVMVRKTMDTGWQMSDKELNWYTTYEYSILELPPVIAKASVQILTLSAFLGGTTIYGDYFQRYASVIDDNSWLWIRLLRTTEGNRRFREMVLALSKKTLILLCTGGRFLPGGISFSLHPTIREWLQRRTRANREAYLDQAANIMSTFCRGISDTMVPFAVQLDTLIHLDACLSSELGPNRTMEDALVHEGRKLDMERPTVLDFASFYRRCSRLEDAKRLQRRLLSERRGAGVPDDDPASINLQLELGQSLRDNSEIQAAMKHYKNLLESEGKLCSVQYCQVLVGLADVNDLLMHYKAARRQLIMAMRLFEQGEQPMANQETLASQRRRDEERLEPRNISTDKPWDLMKMMSKRKDINTRSQRGSFPPLSPSQKLRYWRLMVKALIIRGRVESWTGHPLIAHQALTAAREIGEKFCENDNLTLEATMSVATSILMFQRQPGKAKELAEGVKRRSEEWNGPDHRVTLGALMSLGMIWGRTGYYSEARRCFQTVKEHAKSLFGETAGDVLNELVIGDTYAAEENYIEAEKQYLLAKKKSDELSEPIMERAVCISLFRVYVAQRRFEDAWPLTVRVFRTIPLAGVLRANKVLVTLGVLVLLNMALSSISTGFDIVIGVSVGIALLAQWF